MSSQKYLFPPHIASDQTGRMALNRLTLAFSGPCAMLEPAFLETYAGNSLFQVRFALCLGIVLYAVFGILDAVMAEQLRLRFWFIRYAVVCPAIVAGLLFSFSPRFGKYMQPALTALFVIAGLGIICMTAAGNEMVSRAYYVGLILVFMIGYTFLRVRYIWAGPAGWGLVCVYIATGALDEQLPRMLLVNNAFFCVTANIFGMLVCYTLEYYARKDFFMARLLAEEHQVVEKAKDELEMMVRQRTAMLNKANEELWQEIQAHQRLDWEKKALENQLLQAQKMEAIGTLAGGIAHDFNNILAAIIGHTELALMQLDNSRQAQLCLTEVLNAGQRAKDLVGRILAFSRHGDGQLKPLRIGPVVEEALRLLRASLPPTIAISQKIEVEESIVVADATQIHQIIMNLCTNAAHAMEPRGGTLTVHLYDMAMQHDDRPDPESQVAQLGPGEYICLSVADTGNGIPAHLLDRIFDPYFTTKPKGVGTGLGLAVVRGIVQNHGGVINVQSQPGDGTTFYVCLPRAQSEVAAEIQHLKLLPTGNEKILLVDDVVGLAELGAKLLTTLGYQAESHSVARKALERFTAAPHDFDMVITDMLMPEINGEALARRLLSIRPDIPIIVCTGFSDMVNSETLEKIGVRTVLRKPITIHALAQAIRRVLDNKG